MWSQGEEAATTMHRRGLSMRRHPAHVPSPVVVRSWLSSPNDLTPNTSTPQRPLPTAPRAAPLSNATKRAPLRSRGGAWRRRRTTWTCACSARAAAAGT
eukprot:6095884-Pleurochrysis_carterae.AAC.1